MGCTSSVPSPTDVPDQDIIRKCKDRRLVIKDAIRYREKFAIAHLEYLESLRNVGSLLTQIAGAGEAIVTKPASPRSHNPPPPTQVSNLILALPPPGSPSLTANVYDNLATSVGSASNATTCLSANSTSRLTPPGSPSLTTNLYDSSATCVGSPSKTTTGLSDNSTTRLTPPDSPSNITTGLSANSPPNSPSKTTAGLPAISASTLSPPSSPSKITTELRANSAITLTHPGSPPKVTTILHVTPPGSPSIIRDLSSNSATSCSPRPAEDVLIHAIIQSPTPFQRIIENLTSPNEPLMPPPTPPFSIQGSPPLSPLKLTDEPSLSLLEYRSMSLTGFPDSPTSSSMDETMFTDKGSDYFSPSRDDLEDFSPSPKSSPIQDSSWASHRVFMPSDIPLHVHEQGKIELAVHNATEVVHIHEDSNEDEEIHDVEPVSKSPKLTSHHDHIVTDFAVSPNYIHEQGMTEVAFIPHHIREQGILELAVPKANKSVHTPYEESCNVKQDPKVELNDNKIPEELELNDNQSVNEVHVHGDSDKDERFIPVLEEVMSHNEHEVDMGHLSNEDEDIPDLEEVDSSGSECHEDEEIPYLEDGEHSEGETVIELNGVQSGTQPIAELYNQQNCDANTDICSKVLANTDICDTQFGDVNHFSENPDNEVVKEKGDANTNVYIKVIPEGHFDTPSGDVKNFTENSENAVVKEIEHVNNSIDSKVLQEGHPDAHSDDVKHFTENPDRNAIKEEGDVITNSEKIVKTHSETISISDNIESKAVPVEVIRESSETHIESKSNSEDENGYAPPVFRIFSKMHDVTTSVYEDAHDKAFSKEFVRLSCLSMNDNLADRINNYKKEIPIMDYGGDLPEILYRIDEEFLKAHKSGEAVSKILESDQLSGTTIGKVSSQYAYKMEKMKEDFRIASHASTLDCLHAWEKKLYEEVKDGELIRSILDQKCQQLHELNVKGAEPLLIDKTKVNLKDLNAELLVAYRAMQITSMKIQNITNEELSTQILDLVTRLRNMWQTMTECHHIQQMLALELKAFENSIIGEEPSEESIRAMFELQNELRKWQGNIYYWIRCQKHYVKYLHTWLGLCYEADSDNNSNNKIRRHGRKYDSSPKVRTPFYNLLKEWAESIESLESYEKVIDSMTRFGKAVHMLERVQYHDLKSKRHGERSSRMDQPGFSFRKIYADNLHSFAESLRRDLSDSRRRKTERCDPMDDLEINTTLDLFKHHLPRVFEDLASFAKDAWMMYENVLQKANEKLDEDALAPCSDIVPYNPTQSN